MKDFLNYLLTIPQRIGIYFAKRRALREYRRAIEHARKMELADKTNELVKTTAVGMVAMLDARVRPESAKRTKFPPGGIVAGAEHAKGGMPGPEVDVREWIAKQDADRIARIIKERSEFPANDDREWFAADTSPERMAALLKFEDPTPEQLEVIEQHRERIRKAAEQWRKFDDKPKQPEDPSHL